MNKHTQPKTSTPILRIAAGITAAAACAGIVSAVGVTMYNMKKPAAEMSVASQLSQIDEKSADNCIGYFKQYYYQRTGHAVDFDFNTLGGTDYNETWEFDDCTVTLNAALTDGWRLLYLYTVHVNDNWDANSAQPPQVTICSDVPEAGLPGRAGATTAQEQYIVKSQTPDADGNLLLLGVSACKYAYPLPQNVTYRAWCSRGEPVGSERDIPVNFPAEVPPLRMLDQDSDETYLHTNLNGTICDFRYAAVSPLGMILTNYNPQETVVSDTADYEGYHTIAHDTVTVNAVYPDGQMRNIPLVCGDDAQMSGEISTYQHELSGDGLMTLKIAFTEPLDHSNVAYLALTSNEQIIAAGAVVNDDLLEEFLAKLDAGEMPETAAEQPQDDAEYPLFVSLPCEDGHYPQQTKEFDFGTMTVENASIADCNYVHGNIFGGHLEFIVHIHLNDNYVTDAKQEKVLLYMKTVTYSPDKSLRFTNPFTELEEISDRSTDQDVYFVCTAAAPADHEQYEIRGEDGSYSPVAYTAVDPPTPEDAYYEIFFDTLRIVHTDTETDDVFSGDSTEPLLHFRLR